MAEKPLKITPELLEKCLDTVAEAIVQDKIRGHRYICIYERLERELEALKAKENTLARVRQRVERLKK